MKYKVFKFAVINSSSFINFAEGTVSGQRSGLEIEMSHPFMTYNLN